MLTCFQHQNGWFVYSVVDRLTAAKHWLFKKFKNRQQVKVPLRVSVVNHGVLSK